MNISINNYIKLSLKLTNQPNNLTNHNKLSNIIIRSNLTNEFFITSLFYLYQTSNNDFLLIIISLVLSQKYLDDQSYTLRTWSRIAKIDLDILNSNEKILLQKLDYNLNLNYSKEFIDLIQFGDQLGLPSPLTSPKKRRLEGEIETVNKKLQYCPVFVPQYPYYNQYSNQYQYQIEDKNLSTREKTPITPTLYTPKQQMPINQLKYQYSVMSIPTPIINIPVLHNIPSQSHIQMPNGTIPSLNLPPIQHIHIPSISNSTQGMKQSLKHYSQGHNHNNNYNQNQNRTLNQKLQDIQNIFNHHNQSMQSDVLPSQNIHNIQQNIQNMQNIDNQNHTIENMYSQSLPLHGDGLAYAHDKYQYQYPEPYIQRYNEYTL